MRTIGMAALGLIVGLAGPALAADVTLTVHHFLGPKAPAQTALIEPWAERLRTQSEGRIEVEIYPAMSLGGKPPDLYSQVRDGVADVVWTLPGYTPGVFPRTEVFELPTVHQGSALATTLAIQDLYAEIAPDFEDVHPILLHVHAGQAIHMVDRPIQSVADLAGLKLRIPSRTGAMLIEEWAAAPVGMPVPDLPQALSKGAIEGTLIPFEVALPLKVHDLTRYSITGPDDTRFGTSVFAFLMNKDRYEGLPDELRAVIDANAGAALAPEIGAAWDEVEEPGREAQLASGGEILELDAEAMAEFDARSEAVVARWIEEVSAEGLDGAALVEAARAAIAAHTPTN